MSFKFSLKNQCRIQTIFGHTVFLKLRIGWFSDTQKPPVVVAECQKILDIQYIWGRVFVSIAKIFVFKYSYTIFLLVFTWNIYGKSVARTFFGAFFWAPIPFKRYQNTSAYGTENTTIVLRFVWFRCSGVFRWCSV